MMDHVISVAPDDDLDTVSARLGTVVDSKSESTDPFSIEPDKVSSAGLSQSFKRQKSRVSKRLSGSDASSKQIESQFLTGYGLFAVVEPPYNLDYLAKLAQETNSAHYSAIHAKASNIAGLGYSWQPTPAAKDKIESTAGNEEAMSKLRRKLNKAEAQLNEMIESFNQEFTFAEILYNMWVDYEATGNGYLEVGRKSNGQIGYIGHVPSKTIRLRRERDGYVQMIGNKAIYFANFGDKDKRNPIGNDSNPNELLHIKKYSPVNTYYGVPDIIPALVPLAGSEFAGKFNLDYFENKAVPRYVVIVKGAKLDAQSENRLLEFFQTTLKGQNHRTLYLPLPADNDARKVEFKMEAVESGIQDSSFNNYRKSNISDILMAHRTPLTKVGLAEGVSLAVARDSDKTFKETVTRPEQQRLEKKLNRVVSEMTDIFRLKLNELTLTDESTQSKIDEIYLRWGVYVPNDVRTRMGLAPLADGDKVVAPSVLASERASAQNTDASGNRTRDQRREQNSPDSDGEARNPQGEGRQQA